MPPKTRTNKKDEYCGTCDLLIKETDSYIKCSACPNWLHRKCTKLSDLQFDAIIESDKIAKKTGKKSLIWCCELCDGTITDMLTNFQRYKKMELELSKIRDETKEEINEMKAQLQAFNSKLVKLEDGEKHHPR